MELLTKQYGTINYDKEEIIEFRKGLPGFEDLKNFLLFPVEENNIFYVLHSIENTYIGFIVVSPFDFIKDYEFKIEDEKLKELNISSQEEVKIFNIVTLNSKFQKTTVNLKAPIIINTKLKLGEQIIIDNEKYFIKHPLFKEGSYACDN